MFWEIRILSCIYKLSKMATKEYIEEFDQNKILHIERTFSDSGNYSYQVIKFYIFSQFYLLRSM